MDLGVGVRAYESNGEPNGKEVDNEMATELLSLNPKP